jgi:solute carrier family 25 iron transporter 28/37
MVDLCDLCEDLYESLPNSATPVDHMIAGAAAGIMEHCIIYPVDVVKVLMIRQSKFST